MMNIVSVIDKFTQDALKEAGLIIDDNVNHNKSIECEFIEIDKENPRVEVEVIEV